MLMFMMIMSVTPAMLNNVLEEKMQKISEFLVSSVTPFQLMMGKLTGAVWIGLTLSMIYLSAAFGLAHYFEIADRIPISLYAWFVFFLFIALVIFGSIFSAIGAACSEIRDAQSLMTPVMLLVIIPMMCLGPVFDSPSSTFSMAVSLFPPATPMLMFARIAMQPGPETWEIVLGVILSAAFATACVWAAGKVFRVGILSQGQAPSFARASRLGPDEVAHFPKDSLGLRRNRSVGNGRIRRRRCILPHERSPIDNVPKADKPPLFQAAVHGL